MTTRKERIYEHIYAEPFHSYVEGIMLAGVPVR